MNGGMINANEAAGGMRREYCGVTIQVDAAGRRRWTPETARRLAEESFASELPVEAFAEHWDLGKSMISRPSSPHSRLGVFLGIMITVAPIAVPDLAPRPPARPFGAAS